MNAKGATNRPDPAWKTLCEGGGAPLAPHGSVHEWDFPQSITKLILYIFFLGLKQRPELFEKGCSEPMSLLKVCLRISDPSNKDVESEAIPCLSQLQRRKSPLKGWWCRVRMRDLVQDSIAPWADTATDYGLG